MNDFTGCGDIIYCPSPDYLERGKYNFGKSSSQKEEFPAGTFQFGNIFWITMQEKIILKSILYGILAGGVLLGVYFAVLTLVSGWSFAQSQFASFRYFIIGLALGFGIQIGLFTYLKGLVSGGGGGRKVLGVTGTTSTAAMISCCAHYLVNLAPILGVTGLVTFVSQYQVKLFWVGLLFNAFGILYMINRIIKFKKHYESKR